MSKVPEKIEAHPFYTSGYEDGYRDGLQQNAEDSYGQGYRDGYTEGHEVGEKQGFEAGYVDGERMLYSIDNPLEVITDLEYEVNLVLTHPESYSAQEMLEKVQRTFQKMLKDWGQFIG